MNIEKSREEKLREYRDRKARTALGKADTNKPKSLVAAKKPPVKNLPVKILPVKKSSQDIFKKLTVDKSKGFPVTSKNPVLKDANKVNTEEQDKATISNQQESVNLVVNSDHMQSIGFETAEMNNNEERRDLLSETIQLNIELDSRNDEIHNLRMMNEKLQEELGVFHKRLLEAESQLERQATIITGYSKKEQEIYAELTKEKQLLSDKEFLIVQLSDTIKDLREQASRYNLKPVLDPGMWINQVNLEKLQSDFDNLKNEHMKANSILEEKTIKIMELSSEKESTCQELVEAKQSIQLLEGQLNQSMNETLVLHQESKTQKQLNQSQYDSLYQTIAERDARIVSLKEEMNDLRESQIEFSKVYQERISGLEENRDVLLKKITVLECELKDSEECIGLFEEQEVEAESQIKNLNSKVQEYETSLQFLNEENSTLLTKVSEQSQSIQTLESNMEDTLEACKLLETMLEEADTEKDKMKSKITKLEATIETYISEEIQKDFSIFDLEQQISEILPNSQSTNDSSDARAEMGIQTDLDMNSLITETEQIVSSLKVVSCENSIIKQKINEIISEKKELHEVVLKQKELEQRLMKGIEMLSVKNNELEGELNGLKAKTKDESN